MNRFSSNMLLTAALACASCTAWAQTRVVAAVPFDFRIPGSHLDAGTYAERVRRDVESALATGVGGTPTFFVGGVRHEGAFDVQSLMAALEGG